jgi:hypothetical protein
MGDIGLCPLILSLPLLEERAGGGDKNKKINF